MMRAKVADATPIRTPPSTRGRSRTDPKGRLPRGLPGLVAVLVVIGLWSFGTAVTPEPRIVPTPWEALRAIENDLVILPAAIGATLSNAVVGFIVGGGLAVLMAVVFVQWPVAERLLFRIALVSACVPLVVLAPIFVILLPGEAAKQGLAAVAAFFPTLMSCILGLRSVPASSEELVRSMGGGQLRVLVSARLPAMLPSLFAGLQIAAPAAFVGAILAEWLGATTGLGVLLVQAQSSFEIARTWGVAIVMAVVSGVAYTLVGIMGRLLTPWASADVSLAGAVSANEHEGRSSKARTMGLGMLSVALLLVFWWGGVHLTGLDPYFAKTPLDVLHHLLIAPESRENRAEIAANLVITLRDTGLGYLVGLSAACLLAFGGALSTWLQSAITPLAVVVQALPLVALVPLLTMTFGRDLLGVTVIVTIIAFFPAYVILSQALRRVPVLATDVVRSMGGGVAVALLKVKLPYVLPAVATSAKVTLPLALAGAILAEWTATGEGIGNMLIREFVTSRFDVVWSAAAVLIVTSMVLYGLLSVTERQLQRRSAA